MDLLLGVSREAGSTLVFVSHDKRLASRFGATLSLADINHAGVGAE
jgi:putative ABC transport system ATP-binding protein